MKNIVKITSLLNGEVLVELEDAYCAMKFSMAVQRMGMSSCEFIPAIFYQKACSTARGSWAWIDSGRRRHGLSRGGKKRFPKKIHQ